MTGQTETSVTTLGSPVSVGVLLLAAAAISVTIHEATSQWPAGFDGWGAALFALLGLTLLGRTVARHYVSGRGSESPSR